jgi:Uma2 family endonuclease
MPAREPQDRPSPALFEVAGRKYLKAPVPVHFPSEERVPESGTHQYRREVLRDSTLEALADQALVASDQFLYWDPTDPRRCLAPDLALRLGSAYERISTWKVWERGAPDVAVEIVSDSDRPQPTWDVKLERYRCCGVRELVRFDATNAERPLRVWDLVDGDLVERALDGPRAESLVLQFWWVLHPDETGVPLLRLARDPEGVDLLPTGLERERRGRLAAEAERQRGEAEREREAQARRAAEARIGELEAELRRR